MNAPSAMEPFTATEGLVTLVEDAFAPEGLVTLVEDAFAPEDEVWALLEKTMRVLPRSKGPRRKPRVALLAPYGVPVEEVASRLAVRLDAILVNAADAQATLARPS